MMVCSTLGPRITVCQRVWTNQKTHKQLLDQRQAATCTWPIKYQEVLADISFVLIITSGWPITKHTSSCLANQKAGSYDWRLGICPDNYSGHEIRTSWTNHKKTSSYLTNQKPGSFGWYLICPDNYNGHETDVAEPITKQTSSCLTNQKSRSFDW